MKTGKKAVPVPGVILSQHVDFSVWFGARMKCYCVDSVTSACASHKARVSFYAVCCCNVYGGVNVTPQHVMYHSDSRHVIVDPNPTEPDHT